MNDSQILDFMMSGQYLPAIGALLVLLVGVMRKYGSVKLPWLATQMGGYVLGYATSTLLYVGTSLSQGQAPTAKLLLMALVAGLTASGILDHFRDALTAVRKTPPPSVPPTAILISLVATLGIGLTALSCTGCPGATNVPVVHEIVDCTKANVPAIMEAVTQIKRDWPDWSKMESDAESIGATIGGCALAELVQEYLSSKGAPQNPPSTHAAHDALEKFRAKMVDGSTFHTASGDL